MRIINCNIITSGKVLNNKQLIITNGLISEILDNKINNQNEDDLIVDACGNFVCPGYIDIHTHGGAGFDLMDGTKEALKKISIFHASRGITSMLPTTVTSKIQDIIKILNIVRDFSPIGANILGVHLEGPYISLKNSGAHPKNLLLTPSPDNYNRLLEYKDVIKNVTLSPGLPGIDKFIRILSENGIVVSGGHDDSIDTEIEDAIREGMSHVTHLYCCTSTISRRNSPEKHLGLTEFALLDDRLSVEIIADRKHVPDKLVQLVIKCKGYKKSCLVSDCIRAAGMSQQKNKLTLGAQGQKGIEVEIIDNVAVLPGQNLYAGSITTIDEMVKNLIKYVGVPIEQAVYMATETPASILSLRNKGTIAPGSDADINIIDKDANVIKTFIKGKLINKLEEEV